jgi:hypothetical protein
MASQIFPKKNAAFEFYIGLVSQSNTNVFETDPTIATGDFKVSIDGGAFANLDTLPSVDPAGGKTVKIELSAAEMNGDNIQIVGSDAAGDEWADLIVNIQTASQQVDDLLGSLSIAEAAGVPAAAASAQSMLGRLYAALRSGVRVTATKKQFENDAGSVQWEKDLADDGTEYSESDANSP